MLLSGLWVRGSPGPRCVCSWVVVASAGHRRQGDLAKGLGGELTLN